MHRLTALIFIFSSCAIITSCSDNRELAPANTSVKTNPTPQKLVRGNFTEPTSLDPHKIGVANDATILQDLFEGLISMMPDGTTAPAVALSWSSDDLRSYRFELRRDSHWSNGSPVTAQDFVYALRRAIDPKTASNCATDFTDARILNATAIASGQKLPASLGVKSEGEYGLTIELEQSLSYFIEILASSNCFYPLHRPTLEQHGDLWTRPENYVSNGPFTLAEWNVNESLKLKRNTTYWDANNVRLDEVTYLPINSLPSEFSRYRSGNIDITYSIPDEQYEWILKDIPSQIMTSPRYVTFGLEVNGKKRPLNDQNIRKALAYALNREILTSSVLKRGQKPAFTHTPDKMPQFPRPNLQWARMSQIERETQARTLYRQAGYSYDNPLKINAIYYNADAPKKVALAVTAMWKDILGVEVENEFLEGKSLLGRIQSGDFDVVFLGPNTLFPDPAPILNQRLSIHNEKYGYSNVEFDSVMHSARSIESIEERAKLYAKAESILANDMPFIPIFHAMKHNLVKPHVRGYPESSTSPPKSKSLWIDLEKKQDSEQ